MAAFRRITHEASMRIRNALRLAAVLSCVAAPALANFGGGTPKDPAPSSTSNPAPDSRTATPRQEAEKWYGDAYGDVARAKKDLALGKSRNAEKRFRRALERGERAAAIDSTYHEAFNLVGYCARNLQLYPQSLSAYQRCLALKEDYAPAREYLGELYLETGEIDKAMEQLAWLERLEAEAEHKELKAKIDAKRMAQGIRAEPAVTDTSAASQDE
jgi:tetratricopeptide (TPR) repeat protein